MDALLDFLADNYKWFMIGAIVLLIALVGFIVDGKKKKNKGEQVPEGTATLSQADAMAKSEQTAAEQPAVAPEPSLVFEQPSLNENDTMNELKESGVEPSLTFDSTVANDSQPVDFSQPLNNINNDETINVGTIGEPIVAPDMTVPSAENEISVANAAESNEVIEPTPEVADNTNVVIETPQMEAPSVDIPEPALSSESNVLQPQEQPIVAEPEVAIPETGVTTEEIQAPAVGETVEIPSSDSIETPAVESVNTAPSEPVVAEPQSVDVPPVEEVLEIQTPEQPENNSTPIV